MLKSLFLCVCVLFGAQLSAEASLGETLETQMWEDMKHYNWSKVEENIAPDFKSVHWFGPLDREKEIALIKSLYLGNYKISDLNSEQNGDTITVTYMIAVSETIDDLRSNSKPTPRLSVWKKNNGKWQWIAHANCNRFDDAKVAAKPKFAD
jgi:hypothetical protein